MQKRYVVLIIMLLMMIVGFGQRDKLVTRLLQVGIDRQFSTATLSSLGDGLHVGLCGAGSPLPAPKASGPCVAVAAGGALYIVDVGTDSPRNLARMGWAASALEGVFITHFHSDHIDGLGELATLRWATGDDLTPLTVYGPEGVEGVIAGFNAAYTADFGYRNDHHGDLVAPLSAAGLSAEPFTTPPDGELATVFSERGLTVEALRVDHAPVSPAVGYRFTYGGRTLLISGDTAQSDNIRRFAEGIDLLIHEALSPEIIGMMEDTAKGLGNEIMAKVMFDVRDYHASPREAAETARDAGVGHLLYYHVVPPIIVPGQEALWLNGAGDIFPDYTVGYDGVSFSLPANSTEIIQTRKGM